MVDKKFVINLKGKDFILFAGLLDLAHGQGLTGIETMVDKELSTPAEDRWVIQAIGTFRKDDREATWSAYGDAHAGNSQMRGAYLRHAETRAVARMLRLATNVGMTAFEELGPDAREDRLQPGDPEVIPLQCQTCGADVPPEELGTSRYRFKGIYCAKHRMEMEANESRPRPPDAPPCARCGRPLNEKEISGCMQRPDWFDSLMLCYDDAKAYRIEKKAAEKTPVAA